ncbi:MAG: 50S ribosomal protein L4 [Candidatus Saganbacteria bacterium]|nr:50S ribosomal protein L4 [Candidatus Saganbacteria bacterium]
MVNIPVFDLIGKKAGTVDAMDYVFGIPVKDSVVHSAVKWQLASMRHGNASAKTRAEVRGGGKKPWKQKGTGRARAGTIRSPLWRGGGVLFGPKPRDHSTSLPKKVRSLALRMAISDKVASGKLKIVEKIELKNPKTKEMKALLNGLGVTNALILLDGAGTNEKRAAANLEKIKLASSNSMRIFDILDYEWLVLDRLTLSNIEGRLSKKK